MKLHEKLIFSHLFKKIPTFYETRHFVTVFTTVQPFRIVIHINSVHAFIP